MRKPELHVISNGKLDMERYVSLAARIERFVTCFHLREKTRTAGELCAWISSMTAAGIPLTKIVVNDRADVAWAMQAGGVHLGGGSLPVHAVKQRFSGLRIGRSVHSLDEALVAEQAGADYIIYGHIYETASKPGLPGRGLAELETIVRKLTIPVIAIGGITTDRVREVMRAGAGGIAVLSGIWDAADPVGTAATYADLLTEGRGNKYEKY